MRCVAEVSSFNLMYNLCMYYEKQKSYDKTELTFQPTLVYYTIQNIHLHLPSDSFCTELGKDKCYLTKLSSPVSV